MRLGILGGTFDPIHRGHIAAARAAMECGKLDRVLFIPAGAPPHRSATVAGARDRLEMTRLAIDDERGFEVSDIEIRRGGVSYTVDTLRELRRLHPNDELFLILGWDAAKLFSTWHEPDEVRKLASLIIVTRPRSGAPAGTPDILCELPTPDISGSSLRRALAFGKPVTDMLPPAVADYIATHDLYRDNR